MKIKDLYLFKIFKSRYCCGTFLATLIIISILIPKKIFYGYYSILGGFFILLSSLLLTCFVRNIKEKVVLAKAQKMSFLGIIFLVIGLAAMGTCGVGAPVCGASVAGGVIALLFPGFAFAFFSDHSIVIILFSMFAQVIALYYMNCFKKSHNQSV